MPERGFVPQDEMLLSFPVFSDSTGSGSVCSSWLELLQFASGQTRQNPIGSTLIIMDSVYLAEA